MALGILAHDMLEAQLDQIALLQAMYPSADEMLIDEQTDALLADLRCWCEDTSTRQPTIPPIVSLPLTLRVSAEVQHARISMSIEIPLTQTHDSLEPPHPRLRVRQPDWLTKAELAHVSSNLPEDDIVAAIEHVRHQATQALARSTRQNPVECVTCEAALVRVWFYFPSISTREKRDDIVKTAPGYGLTGFLLAGKPGILCLEGGAQEIDDYMKFIKTESWGNIPSQHKKVSEVYRQEGEGLSRSFSDMEEITNQLEKRGERSNRGDMKALERFLAERGLQDAFSKVLM
jgi:hypothetical protein